MAYTILEHIRELVEIGFPLDQIPPIAFSISISDFIEKIDKMKMEVAQWREKMHAIFNEYPKLLLLSMPKLLQLHDILKVIDPLDRNAMKQLCHEVSFLLPCKLSRFEDILSKVKVCYAFTQFLMLTYLP